MKLRTRGETKPAYEPMVLEVTFETLGELVLFRKMMCANTRVPDMLLKDGDIECGEECKVATIMGEIHREVVTYELKWGKLK